LIWELAKAQRAGIMIEKVRSQPSNPSGVTLVLAPEFSGLGLLGDWWAFGLWKFREALATLLVDVF
jgi:hypothetical protein